MQWYIFGVLSSVCFSVYYVMLKKNLYREHIPDYLTLYAFILALLSFFFLPKVNFEISWILYLLVYLDALSLTLFFITLTSAYKHLEVSESNPLSNVMLILTTLIGVLLFHDRLKVTNFIGIGLMLIGAYILEVGTKIRRTGQLVKHLRNKYVKLLALSVLFATISVTIDKIVLNPEVLGWGLAAPNIFTMHFLTRMFVFLNFFLIFVFRKFPMQGIKHALTHHRSMIIVACVFYMLGNVFYYVTMSKHYSSLVVALLSLSSLFTTVIGGELFHEHHLKQKIFASCVMIAATYLIVM